MAVVPSRVRRREYADCAHCGKRIARVSSASREGLIASDWVHANPNNRLGGGRMRCDSERGAGMADTVATPKV